MSSHACFVVLWPPFPTRHVGHSLATVSASPIYIGSLLVGSCAQSYPSPLLGHPIVYHNGTSPQPVPAQLKDLLEWEVLHENSLTISTEWRNEKTWEKAKSTKVHVLGMGKTSSEYHKSLIAFLSQFSAVKPLSCWVSRGSIQDQFLFTMMCLFVSIHWPTLNLIFCAYELVLHTWVFSKIVAKTPKI